MKISQILNEFSEGAQPGVATTAAQTPQAQAAAQAIQKGLAVLQQQLPNFDASFNTTDAIQEIMPDGTVVMDSNLQPSALQNVRKILALGGGANFKVTMSTQTIPSATGQQVALQAKPGVAEGDRPFRGVDGARYRDNDEQHDLDPTDWYIVKDGEMFLASIYPRHVQQAIAQGFSRTRAEAEAEAEAEAKLRDNSQGVAEDSLGLKKLHDTLWTVISEQTIDEENINEIDPGMIANLYSVFPTVTKIIVSNALDKARKEAKETSIMIDVMKKHANNQPVTPEENEAMKSQFKDIVSYGLSAVAGVLTGAVAGPAAGVGVALAGAYKKELLTLLQTKGPEVLIGLLKSKGKLDVVDILSAKLLGKHALPFYAAPAKLTTGSVNQGVAEGSLEEIDRRGFLKGVGAAAAAGAAGSAMSAPFNHGNHVDQMTGKENGKYSEVRSDNSNAVLSIQWPGHSWPGVWIEIPGATINFDSAYGTTGRVKINGTVKEMSLDRVGSGSYSKAKTDIPPKSILTTSGDLWIEVPIYRKGNQIYKFTIEPDLITKSIPDTPAMPSPSGNHQQATGPSSSYTGPSSSYAGRVRAKLKPNIVFPEEARAQISGNPLAEVEVKASADGSITDRKLIKSSGVKAWDDAVLRAIDKMETLPRDVDGRVPSPMVLSFRPKDTNESVNQGVAEAGNANSGRRGPDYQDNSPVVPGRVEHLPQGLRHHADASRYGGTEPDDKDDRLLGPQQRHRLHRAVTPDDLDEQEKIAGRHDPDDFDDMIGRLKKLAGAGPLKTVWDPAKRVYKNVPHAVQPAQQPKKAPQ